MKDNDRLVKAISKIGEMLLENGAETLRVEDDYEKNSFKLWSYYC